MLYIQALEEYYDKSSEDWWNDINGENLSEEDEDAFDEDGCDENKEARNG